MTIVVGYWTKQKLLLKKHFKKKCFLIAKYFMWWLLLQLYYNFFKLDNLSQITILKILFVIINKLKILNYVRMIKINQKKKNTLRLNCITYI